MKVNKKLHRKINALYLEKLRTDAQIMALIKVGFRGFHFMDYAYDLEKFCDENPTGYCIFRYDEFYGRGKLDATCIFCGTPYERK